MLPYHVPDSRPVDEDASVAATDSTARLDRAPSRRGLPPVALAIGDAAVLILWAVLGLIRHTEGVTLAGLARNAGPILIGWFSAAGVLGTYTRHRAPLRTVLTWSIGISAGVVLRAVLLHRAWNGDEWAFFGVTLAVTGLLLAAWRGIALVAGRALARRFG